MRATLLLLLHIIENVLFSLNFFPKNKHLSQRTEFYPVKVRWGQVSWGGRSIWDNVLEYYDYEIAWFIHLGYLMNSMKRRSTYVQGLCCYHSVIVIVPWPPCHVTSLCPFTKPGKEIAWMFIILSFVSIWCYGQ